MILHIHEKDNCSNRIISKINLAKPPAASACKRVFTSIFTSKAEPTTQRVARLACGCYSCPACCRRKAYAVALNAAKAATTDDGAGLKLAVAIIDNTDAKRKSDQKARKRSGGRGAAFCESADGKQIIVLGSFDADTSKLHRDYHWVTLEEGLAEFAKWANALPPSPPPANGIRGRSRIGSKGTWMITHQKREGDWKREARMFILDPNTLIDILDRHGIIGRRKGGGQTNSIWMVEWNWPASWSAEQIEAVKKEISQARDQYDPRPESGGLPPNPLPPPTPMSASFAYESGNAKKKDVDIGGQGLTEHSRS